MKLTPRKAAIAGAPLRWCGDRLIVREDGNGDPVFWLVDLRGKRQPFPKQTSPHACDDRRILLDVAGKQAGGVWSWKIASWDLKTRLTPFATCTPDDKLGHLEIAGERIIGTATERGRHSIVELANNGTRVREVGIGTEVPFRFVTANDLAVWFYITGKGGVVDLERGTHRPLVGGAVRIGRRHDKGIRDVALANGHVLATFGTQTARVWKLATKKLVRGPWERESVDGACWLGDRVCWWSRSTFASAQLSGQVDRRGALPGRVTPLGDGAHVVCFSDERTLEIWTLARRVARFRASSAIRGFAASPRYLAVGLDTQRTIVLERS